MNEDLPALTTQTKLENHAIKDVKVEARFTVKYIFDARISEGLSIPYAVAVDGVAQEIYKNKPKRVSGDNGQIVTRRKRVRAGRATGRICGFS